VEGTVCPSTNKEVAQRSPVLTNTRAHMRIAESLEIAELIASSVALHFQGAVFPLSYPTVPILHAQRANALIMPLHPVT